MQNKSAYMWGLVGRFVPQGIYLITTILLARFLSPDDFGQLGVLTIIFVTANILLDSGLGGSLIKEKSISPIDCSSIGVFNVVTSIVIYIILFFLAQPIESYFAINGLSKVVRLVALVFPISALGLVPRALLNRRLDFKKKCINSIIGVSIASVVSIVIAINQRNVYALVGYQLSSAAVTTICDYIASKYRFSLKFAWKSLRHLLPFGIYTTVISIVDTIYENLLTTLTGKYMDIQEAGYLYQAKKIEDAVAQSFATTVGAVTFPILTRLKDERDVFIMESTNTLKVMSSFISPLLITLAIFSKEITVFLYGNKWEAASFYLEGLTIAGVFLIIETLIRNYIKALCEVKKLLGITVLKRILGIAIIISSMICNPRYMIYGYIISTIIGLLINVKLFSATTGQKFMHVIFLIMYTISPCLLYYWAFNIQIVEDQSPIVKILLSSFVLMLIYFIILPLQGINPLGQLRYYLRKKK